VIVIACDTQFSGHALKQFRGASMGTTYTVKVVNIPRDLKGTTVQTEIDAILQGINQRMSTYVSDSELSLFNRNAEISWIDASAELVDVVEQALNVSRLTGGAFDVTVGPLVNLWGFGSSTPAARTPSKLAIDAALAGVGYTRIHVRRSPTAIKKERPDIYVDLSAIAKGYAVDKVAERLEVLGIENYMVEVGGEVRANGYNSRGAPWRIAIEKPSDGERVVYTIVELNGMGLATSGDYRNYFEKDGRRYSHTIDPQTGRPITHKLASVTVASQSAMRADAFATALLVMGPEAGFRLAEEINLAAFFIIKTEAGFTHKRTSAFSLIPSDSPR
jgi:thiamine biosynthesis lipoprotein